MHSLFSRFLVCLDCTAFYNSLQKSYAKKVMIYNMLLRLNVQDYDTRSTVKRKKEKKNFCRVLLVNAKCSTSVIVVM